MTTAGGIVTTHYDHPQLARRRKADRAWTAFKISSSVRDWVFALFPLVPVLMLIDSYMMLLTDALQGRTSDGFLSPLSIWLLVSGLALVAAAQITKAVCQRRVLSGD